MSIIIVKKSIVRIAEQDLRTILAECMEAREETDFTSAPLPNDDMDTKTFIKELCRRGVVTVSSPCPSHPTFEVELAGRFNNSRGTEQESVGYKRQ